MARCASERRAEGEVNSYRNAAGIGRTIFNRVVILLTSGSCRLETNSDLAALSEREIGRDSPVDCHASERRAEGKRRSAASGGSSKPLSRKCPNGRAPDGDGHWQTRRGQEAGAAPPVAEVASRFQGSVPMAAPRMWAGIGRHDEVSGRSKLAMDKAVGRTIPNRVVILFNQ